jgi:hypothetical protein
VIDFDAIAHDPRVGYPRMSAEALAEVLRADEERWQRCERKLVHRPRRVDWNRTRYFRR